MGIVYVNNNNIKCYIETWSFQMSNIFFVGSLADLFRFFILIENVTSFLLLYVIKLYIFQSKQ